MSFTERVTAVPLSRTILFLIASLASFLILAASPERVMLVWTIPVYTLLWAVSAFALLTLPGLYGAWRLHQYRKARIAARSQSKAKTKALEGEESEAVFWRTYNIAVLGVGLGILAFLYRPQVEGLVRDYFILRTWSQMLLAALLALGVIMGFFIVRNWSKEQGEFVNSLKAIFGGVFVSALLGQLPGITLLAAVAHYGLGFALSGGINLILYSKLIRRYAAQKDMPTRAVIDLLYGSDKAAVIDTYFQKRFDEDPSFARAKLVETLRKYREKVMIEYARKMSHKMFEGREMFEEREMFEGRGHEGMRLYQLLAIECEETDDAPEGGGPASSAEDAELLIKYREVKDFTSEMFRMGITIRQGDNLIYIAAPGEYRKPFPYYGSVAGLALLVRQTIVMDRDRNKKFRTERYKDGLCPAAVEDARGLDEIDYLSYVSVPITSNLSNPEEVGLGIINVDTKLFAVPPSEKSSLKDVERLEANVFRAKTEKKNLSRWGTNLYGQEADKADAVKYLEEMAGVVVPILELYLRGLPGA